MSIPPLVCNSPPPADQCEEDKDADYYDIGYNLSQEEDDDYGYSGFASYNTYNTNTKIQLSNEAVCERLPELPHKDDVDDDPASESQLTNNNNVKVQNNDSTLGLNLKIEQVKVENGITECKSDASLEIDNQSSRDMSPDLPGEEFLPGSQDESPTKNFNSGSSQDSYQASEDDLKFFSGESAVSVGCKAAEEQPIAETFDSGLESEATDFNNSNIVQNLSQNITTSEESSNNFGFFEEFSNVKSSADSVNSKESALDSSITNVNQLIEDISVLKVADDTGTILVDNEEDDFGDFDDFRSANPVKPADPVLPSSDDPWVNQQSTDTFNEFKADFNDFSNPHSTPDSHKTATQPNNPNAIVEEDDDDFGDFDDFKSSTVAPPKEEAEDRTQTGMLLRLNSLTAEKRDEIVDEVLGEIFPEALLEPEGSFDSKLESQLCEVWGHLCDVEVRQPYMVRWNSSLAQNMLLKALNIDSRNILYAPKWSQGTPKYATNLTAAPLQPLRPAPPPEPAAPAAPAQPDTWTDPFTADGKESTYAEALLLDLEHLMATLDQMAHGHAGLKISDLLTQAGKAESSAAAAAGAGAGGEAGAGAYVGRQISLPDTHIFTPSDSQEPRSTTIHYAEPAAAPADDFRDFQGAFSEPPPAPAPGPPAPAPAPPAPASILQPVRLEPPRPALNWPEPGEVRRTFDDYSEFLSGPSSEPGPPPRPPGVLAGGHAEVDDDFDAFQSVAPVLPAPLASGVQAATVPQATLPVLQSTLPAPHSTLPAVPTTLPVLQPVTAIPSVVASTNTIDLSLFESKPDFSAFQRVSDATSFTSPTPAVAISNSLFSTPIEDIPISNIPSVKTIAPAQPASAALPPPLAPGPPRPAAQILHPLSLEGFSQINWPDPGSMDLQDLSRFNPIETVPSLQAGAGGAGGAGAAGSPARRAPDDDWGEFVSSRPARAAPAARAAPPAAAAADDEWTEFVCAPKHGLNTISLNVQGGARGAELPRLHYVTPHAARGARPDRHLQNL